MRAKEVLGALRRHKDSVAVVADRHHVALTATRADRSRRRILVARPLLEIAFAFATPTAAARE